MKKISSIHFSSTISMSLVLLLIGLVSLLLFVAHDMSVYVKENINLSLILDDNVNKKEIDNIELFMSSGEYTKSINYISKEEALNEHIEAMGEDPSDFLGYNPLKASLEIKLNANYANTDSVRMLETKLQKFKSIERVVYQKELIGLVNDNVRKISFVLLGLAVVLLIIAVALINNTVRLSIYSNRFLINSMQLVGATDMFISKPYIKKAALNGLLSAGISLAFMMAVIYYVMYEFGLTEMSINISSMVWVSTIVIISGMLLMSISTYWAVSKYLRMNTDELYTN